MISCGEHDDNGHGAASVPNFGWSAQDRVMVIWNPGAVKPIILKGHEADVTSATLSFDGAQLVTSSWDDTAHQWDMATGQEIAVLKGHKQEVLSAAFNPYVTRVVTASADGTVRIWRVFPTLQSLVDAAKKELPLCLTEEQREENFLDPEVPDWCYDRAKWPYKPRRFGLVGKDLTDQIASQIGIAKNAGAIISRVIADLPAEAAALKVDDVIVDVGTRPASAQMLREFENWLGDGPMTFKVLRDGADLLITVTPRKSDAGLGQ